MATIYEIPLRSSESSFTLRTDLADTTVIMKFDYNTRNQIWHVSLYDSDENPIVAGRPMFVDTDLFGMFRNENIPDGLFLLHDTSGEHAEAGRDDLGGRCRLFFSEDD